LTILYNNVKLSNKELHLDTFYQLDKTEKDMPNKNKIAVFIDYDNIKINMKTEPPEKLAEKLGYNRMKSWLSDFGEVIAVFVFAPAITISANIEFFYKLGFIPIACPMMPQKSEEKGILYGVDKESTEVLPPINKTDDMLISVAEMIIKIAPDITHICIASADHHFVPIARLAKQEGKKVMLVISSLRPSKELLRFADKNGPNIGDTRMIHYFNPIRD